MQALQLVQHCPALTQTRRLTTLLRRRHSRRRRRRRRLTATLLAAVNGSIDALDRVSL